MPQELEELNHLIATSNLPSWVPLPGPQTEALETEADILFYGGAAGGGKTDLLVGLSLTKHFQSVIYRKEGTQHKGIIRRITEIVGTKDYFNGVEKVWKLPDGRTIDLSSCPHLGAEEKHQGIPHDLVGFDEITHFLELQFRFLIGWVRTTKKNTRCRVVCTGNPPTDSDGEWVIRFWGPWLDPDHPNPAGPGELRWFASLDGKDVEVPNGDEFEHDGDTVKPMSRTFIPSKITDNEYLMSTGYKSNLQALPEPLRSQMLNGDFLAGVGGDPFQVIPSAWVKQSMDRWTPEGKAGRTMDSLGADIARGGKDKTCFARRYGTWFDEPLSYPGSDTPNGPVAASLAVACVRDAAPIHVDVIGVGGSVYDHLDGLKIQTIGVNVAESSHEKDRSGKLGFANVRAELWWKMREALDPEFGAQIILPNCPELKADLCCARWKLTARGIQVESKEDLIKRIGRSPDLGDSYNLALINTPKRAFMRQIKQKRAFK